MLPILEAGAPDNQVSPPWMGSYWKARPDPSSGRGWGSRQPGVPSLYTAPVHAHLAPMVAAKTEGLVGSSAPGAQNITLVVWALDRFKVNDGRRSKKPNPRSHEPPGPAQQVALRRLHSPGMREALPDPQIPPGLPHPVPAPAPSTQRELSQPACAKAVHRQGPAQLPAMRMTARSAGSSTLPLLPAPPPLRRLR